VTIMKFCFWPTPGCSRISVRKCAHGICMHLLLLLPPQTLLDPLGDLQLSTNSTSKSSSFSCGAEEIRNQSILAKCHNTAVQATAAVMANAHLWPVPALLLLGVHLFVSSTGATAMVQAPTNVIILISNWGEWGAIFIPATGVTLANFPFKFRRSIPPMATVSCFAHRKWNSVEKLKNIDRHSPRRLSSSAIFAA